MTYLLKKNAETPIDGAILQAPVSDREGLVSLETEKTSQLATVAEKMVKEGRGSELVPGELAKNLFKFEQMTAYRAWSLLCIG